jgi:hypothetical protein
MTNARGAAWAGAGREGTTEGQNPGSNAGVRRSRCHERRTPPWLEGLVCPRALILRRVP